MYQNLENGVAPLRVLGRSFFELLCICAQRRHELVTARLCLGLATPHNCGEKTKKSRLFTAFDIIKLTFEISRARHGARLCLGLRPPPLLIAPKSTKKISSIYSEITMELTFEKSQTREVVPPPLPCGSLPLRKGKKCCCHASFENWFATKRARSQNWSPYSIDCANTLLTRFRF